MRKLFLLATVSLFVSAIKAQQAAPSAESILKEAYQQAAKENKKVFIMFHASWCGWCKKMNRSMEDERCKNLFNDNFVIRHLVTDESKDKKHLENPGAAEMKVRYNGDGQGIPFWLIFDAQGKLLADSKDRKEGESPEQGENTGCPASEKEVNYFIAVLKSVTSLNAAELEIIRKRFRENDN